MKNSTWTTRGVVTALALTMIVALGACTTGAHGSSHNVSGPNAGPDCVPVLVLKQGANLGIGCNLTNVTIAGADLSPAGTENPQRTYGPEVVLVGAHIINSNLNEVNLKYSNFTGVTIINTTMVGANLPIGNFNNATLTDVDLSGAQLSESTWVGAHLTGLTLSVDTVCPDGVNWDPTGQCRSSLPGYGPVAGD